MIAQTGKKGLVRASLRFEWASMDRMRLGHGEGWGWKLAGKVQSCFFTNKSTRAIPILILELVLGLILRFQERLKVSVWIWFGSHFYVSGKIKGKYLCFLWGFYYRFQGGFR